jgi:hypothetical protein
MTAAMRRRDRRRGRVDFAQVSAAALAHLPELLVRWLPDGQLIGREWTSRNPRRVDRRPGSMKVNIDSGRWADFAVEGVRGGNPISLAAYLAGCSLVDAARYLAHALGMR